MTTPTFYKMDAITLDSKNFESCGNKSSGFIVGLISDDNKDAIVVIGLCSRDSKDEHVIIEGQKLYLPNFKIGFDFVCRHYPAGTNLIGIWIKIEKELSDDGVKIFQSKLVNIYKLNQNLHLITFLFKDSNNKVRISCYHRNKDNGHLNLLNADNKTSIKGHIHKKTVTLQLQATLELHLPAGNYNSIVINDYMSKLRDFIKHCSLWLPHHQIILDKMKGVGLNIGTLSDTKSPVPIEILQSVMPSSLTCPPVVTLTPISSIITLPVPLDVIGIFHTSMGMRTIAKMMKEQALYQLDMIAERMKYSNTVCSVSIHHYSLPNQHVPVTIIYPDIPMKSKPLTDSNLLPIREDLHEAFCLSRGQPYLRKTNLQSFDNTSIYLTNPHDGLSLQIAPGSVVAMVTGSYSYHHYMQDGFNDKDWGCAYRSLQTLWSWFFFQGYTGKTIPTHLEIQQALVDCGDKQKSFVGSKEWIGSFEVSTVLNQLLQIDCQIHQCPSGDEMAGVGQILLRHFQTQGTPVMIGGGVLAHTILGVDYNQDIGSIKFLILDPHYIGPEELRLVLGKWCGWKSVTFWDKTASYNMCMPLKPQEI